MAKENKAVSVEVTERFYSRDLGKFVLPGKQELPEDVANKAIKLGVAKPATPAPAQAQK